MSVIMNSPTNLYCVVGCPLAQTMAPHMHNWGFNDIGFPGVSLPFSVPAENLPLFFQSVRILPIKGGSITIPHKIASMKLVDKVTDRGKRVGAINAFFWKDNELWGDNTDVVGFMYPLKGRSFKKALVLGGGGVSRAAVAGLQEIGVPEICISNRTPEKAEVLVRDFKIKQIAWDKRAEYDADLVVNATSMGMIGANVNETPYPKEAYKGRKGLMYDIVFNPLETRLLKEAKEAGWEIQDALTMLIQQACTAFRHFTGKELNAEGCTAHIKMKLGL